MLRATWQGYVALGQLGVPVRLYTATQSMRPRFVQLHESDGSPVERELRCLAEQREIESSEIIRAVEYEPGRYIALTDRELAQAVSDVKTIAIQQFCDPSAIPSAYYDKPYYIVPAKGGERAYSLLREVLARRHIVAIAKFAIYHKEHVALVSVYGDLLLLQQLRFASEIVLRSNIKAPPLPKPSPSEIEALSAVVDRLSGPFFAEDYHDEYAERIQQLIERKAKGLSVPRRERVAPYATPESDIVAVLQDVIDSKPILTELHK